MIQYPLCDLKLFQDAELTATYPAPMKGHESFTLPVKNFIRASATAKLSKNFWLHEFNTGQSPLIWVDPELIDRLEQLRKKLNNSVIKLTSGYRTPLYNAVWNGATWSQHMYGRAADLYVPNYGRYMKRVAMAAAEIFPAVEFCKRLNFVHVDIGWKRGWKY